MPRITAISTSIWHFIVAMNLSIATMTRRGGEIKNLCMIVMKAS